MSEPGVLKRAPVRTVAALICCLLSSLLVPLGCKPKSTSGAASAPSTSASSDGRAPPLSSIAVDHGELDQAAPSGAPEIAASVIAGTVYKLPNTESRRLGYVRLGGRLRREPDPQRGGGCKGEFYRVYPAGYVCTDEFTIDLDSPLVRAASVRADLSKPLPYHYAFVRATAPQYLRVPSRAEQDKSEFGLDEHMAWYAEHEKEVQQVILGANDVPLDGRGIPVPGLKPAASFRPSTSLSLNELFGGSRPDEPLPFWLADGKRGIPNVSAFAVGKSSIFADRVRRKTGLSLVGAFDAVDGDFHRRFAVTVDLRLIPATKLKPDTGSPFHGLELRADTHLPFAWVLTENATTYKLIKGKDEARPADPVPKRAVVPLTGAAKVKGGKRYYQTAKDPQRWLLAEELGLVALPSTFPEPADKGEKWIDISLRQQTLVLFEGKRPVYATLVSTGRDRMGDPKKTLSTPQGTFRLKSKHIAAVMDSQENSGLAGGARSNTASTTTSDPDDHPEPAPSASTPEKQALSQRLLAAEKAGKKLNTEDQRRLTNIKKGRDPEYGVTQRRGSGGFELRDVPWIQYFAAGYALHGAYWHDVFGIPRSHGCVNLAPVDARYVFHWSDPPVPTGWHGINVGPEMGEGTTVVIHE